MRWRGSPRAFDDGDDGCVLLLQRTVTALGYDGQRRLFPRPARHAATAPASGEIAPLRLRRRAAPASAAPFEDAPEGRFSLNRLYDRAEEAGRLHAIVHDGEWFHVGTPDSIAATEAELGYGQPPERRAAAP